MTHPITPTPLDDDGPGFSATADRLEDLIGILSANVDRYAELLAGTKPFAITMRHLNERIDDQNSVIAEANVRTARLLNLAYEVDSHRESVAELAHNLRIIPRWHWIRRNRIRHQLAVIAIAITRRTTKGLTVS